MAVEQPWQAATAMPGANATTPTPDGRLPAPLSGITVLDLGRVVSGPLCALTLAELGATVIRVEKPGGDWSWRVPPFLHPDGTVDDRHRGRQDISLSHAKRDHGKLSIELDYGCA